MKLNRNKISIVIGVILLASSFMGGYKIGLSKEFYQTHDIECVYGDNLEIQSVIHSREWTNSISKITMCNKETKSKILKQLRKEGKLLIRYSKVRRQLIKKSQTKSVKRKASPLLTAK